MTLSIGARLGPYEVLSPLGAGGMGEVYRAKDSRLGRDVAIKVLPAAFAANAERLRRFEQEARAASALNHPNILAIFDVGTHGEAPYVVSELLDGETLRERLAGASLPVRKATDYATQIAEGLAAAQEKGIVHRDLKPENLFVTKDGRIKILDFGLAKLTRPEVLSGSLTEAPTSPAETEPGVVMGTVGYMSPEQVRGQPADPRSDIFAFGAILYEMLTGRRAFRGTSPADTMSAILKEEPEFAPTHPDASPALEHIVRRCLEKNPEERFQSARDLAFALRETSSGSAPQSVSLPVPRSRSILWLAPLGLLVLLAALIAVNVGDFRERLFRGSGPARIQSLAVLPLENFSRDPEQEYFADGMTEELIAQLSQVRSLRVISRTSVMTYKGTKKPLPEIARELRVDGVLEGSVQRAGNRVRITAQLIEAATDQHLWARSYERDLRDVLSLQSEVARAIAREIKIKLTPQDEARLARDRPVSPEVYQLYLRGRFYWNKRTEEGLKKSIEYFEQAIEKDPAYASAYSGLADCYLTLYDYDYLKTEEATQRAKAAAKRALEIDGTLAEAHNSLAHLSLHDWRWSDAEREFKRAIELDPNYALAHHWYALCLTAMGRLDEAVAEVKRAQELDPLSLRINADVGMALHAARRYDQAIEQERKTLELDPNFRGAYWILGLAYEQKGMFEEAVKQFQEALTRSPGNPNYLASLAHAYASAGRKGEARKVLDGLREQQKQNGVSPFFLALVYTGLGEKELAFEWLEMAYRERSGSVRYLKVEPRLDPLREDPRFADLMRRVGLPP